MEQEIITIMKKRNNYLEKFKKLNRSTMDEIPVISDDDLCEFFKKREALLGLIDSCDKEISSLSMCNWERFNFEPEYKAEYIALASQKKKLVTTIIDQDLFIMSKIGISFVENIA